jgi:LPS O-antigen subunit length determinant protein (WzzB/FepE family)
MNENQVNTNIIKAIYKSRRTIILTSLVFLIAAMTISLIMPKKYEAFGLVYPAESNSIYDVVNKPSFGFEIQADRLIQLFDSQMMRDQIIKEFDLVNHYQIDTNKIGWQHSLIQKYHKNISFSRTKYLSVQVRAKMNSPELAAAIVNRMIDYIDTINRNIFIENTLSLASNLNEKLSKQEVIVDSLLKTIVSAEAKNLPSTLAVNTLNTINHRNENGVFNKGDNIIKEALSAQYSIETEKTINNYYIELGILNQLKAKLNETNEKITLPFPKVYRVTEASVDDVPTSPSILLNSILGLIVGFCLSIFFVSLKHNWKRIKQTLQD